MGLKLIGYKIRFLHGFESGVILYGTKTDFDSSRRKPEFESGVILYGTKTRCHCGAETPWFESGVILYGTKTLA